MTPGDDGVRIPLNLMNETVQLQSPGVVRGGNLRQIEVGRRNGRIDPAQ